MILWTSYFLKEIFQQLLRCLDYNTCNVNNLHVRRVCPVAGASGDRNGVAPRAASARTCVWRPRRSHRRPRRRSRRPRSGGTRGLRRPRPYPPQRSGGALQGRGAPQGREAAQGRGAPQGQGAPQGRGAQQDRGVPCSLRRPRPASFVQVVLRALVENNL